MQYSMKAEILSMKPEILQLKFSVVYILQQRGLKKTALLFLSQIIGFLLYWVRARCGAVGSGTALQFEKSRVRFPVVSLEFFINIILPAALWSWD
jgi:hypothetical protein